ncbi:MAG: hypothetical protein C0608_08125 [Deltaproteobacteria bacterium]|nr:MAG: hypothetical protein C0608_08125 [Deltaproteobacteria bacterium]
MNFFDVFFFACVGVFAIAGALRGAARQIFSIAGVVIGAVAALRFYHRVAEYMPVAGEGLKLALGFAVILIGAMLLAWLAGYLFQRLMAAAGLGFVNRLLGAGLGAVKAFLIVAVVAVVLVEVFPPRSPILAESVTLPFTLKLTSAAVEAVPSEVKSSIKVKIEALEEYWARQRK